MSQPVFLVINNIENAFHDDFQSPQLHEYKSFLMSKKSLN